MAELFREGSAVWKGNLRNGTGLISTESGAVVEQPYSFGTRFEDKPGTNPEELIASAHAACYSMALANTLAKKGHQPESIETLAVCTLESLKGGGFKISKMRLHVRGQVPGIDEETFQAVAMEADKGCPVSNLLRCGLEIEHQVNLL
jgi:lipoyl-dependent peroxiredoxin